MKKITFLLLLLTISVNAYCQFVWIGNDTQGNKHYIDLSSIKKDGSKRKVWTKNIRKEIVDNDLVIKSQEEFDCKNDSIRTLYTIIYSDLNEKNISSTYVPYDKSWSPIVPDSIASFKAKFICI